MSNFAVQSRNDDSQIGMSSVHVQLPEPIMPNIQSKTDIMGSNPDEINEGVQRQSVD